MNVITQRRGIITVALAVCSSCKKVEILPHRPVFDACDYYEMVKDSAEKGRVPTFNFARITQEELAAYRGIITLGIVNSVEVLTNGVSDMPVRSTI